MGLQIENVNLHGANESNGSILSVGYNKTHKSNCIEYWQKRFASVTPTFFPLRSSPSRITPFSSSLRCFPIIYGNLTRGHGIELSTLIILAYALVLSAHSGSSDEVVFGYVYYGKKHETSGLEKQLEHHRQIFPHNVTFDWSQMTIDFLRHLQNEMAESLSHSRVASSELSVPNVAPLFRTVLDLHRLSMTGDKLYTQTSQIDNVDYDLALYVRNVSSEEIEIEARFALESMSGPEIDVFQDHFGAALASIVQNLRCPLRDVDLVSPEEKHRLIVERNPIYPSGPSLSAANNVTQLIEEQVRKTPQKIALQFGQEMFITYHEMDTFANNLAHTLIAHGVKRGDMVGIYIDKSCEMFISILAIHKSSGAYVPLDPAQHAERIQTILGLANVRIVLTSRELQKQFDSLVSANAATSLAVDVCELSPASKPDVTITRDDICHVLFTSGTTGTPKGAKAYPNTGVDPFADTMAGVVLNHGCIIESLLGARKVLGIRDDRILPFSDYTFDVSVWDWSIALTDGGTLCIVPKRELMDNLGKAANSMDVTFLGTTPTVLALIKPDGVPSLRTCAVGGELLTPEVRNTWADHASLVNVYGPTEASTGVIARPGITSSTEGSNIGWCFGVNVAYVLDERLRPVPLGCAGELFLGGAQVARGYLNNPKETSKAFIDDPFRPGSTMYATGDLVRIHPVDGSFFYMGRRDMQIKIRGLRMETGEIETVLKTASDLITNAVVLKVNIGNDTLVAFLEYPSDIGNSGAQPTIVRNGIVASMLPVLRDAVRRKLPSYMAPGHYVVLNRFPLSASGKLDRKALGNFFHLHEKEIREQYADSRTSSDNLQARAPPRNKCQASLRSLWALVLNLNEDTLAIDDDFFTVGGDSISAIQFASAAREAGISLQATDVIENRTIRAMAHVAESAVANHAFDDDDIPPVGLNRMHPHDLTLMHLDQAAFDVLRNDLLPKHGLLPSDVLDIYPCTAIQTSFLMAGLVVDSAYIVRHVYELPAGTVSMRLQQAFEDFLDHPNGSFLRTSFVFDPSTNRYLQVVMRPGCKRMEWATVTVSDEVELDLAVRQYQDDRGSVKFEPGELQTRLCVFEVNGVPRVLAWSSHHALLDHWSMNNAESDIGDMYAGRPLPPRRSFKPMIKYLEGLDRTAGLDFWRRHLLDATPTSFLQALPGAPRAVADAAVCREVRTDHSSLTKQFGIMASSLVTAAWSIVLSAHTGGPDVVFGQIMSGRSIEVPFRYAPIKDIDSMAGNTLNTVARRVILKSEASVLHTLREIQSEQIKVSKHEHIALADLISEGIPVSSLFRSLLNFTNLPGDQKQAASEIEDATDYVLWNHKPGGLDGQDFPFGLSVTPLGTDGFSVEGSYSNCVAVFDTHPDATVRDVNLISASEEQRLLWGRNPPFPLDALLSPAQNISELIERQVRKTPQRIALQFDQEVFLTYSQMDNLSNALACKLVNGSVKRGALVALYMEKSVEMFLSILAVHKAGGAYVPLDPEYPADRVQTIVSLAQAVTVLTTRELQSQLRLAILDADVCIVLVDFMKLLPATKPDVDPMGRDDISHVLFTSGSTGTPKGVVLTHGSTVESALGSREVIGPLNGRVLQFSNYTFDVSVWDWSATFSAGGTLCVVPKQRLLGDLGSVAHSLDVTFLGTTPTVAALITPDQIPSLQTLQLGGEVLTPAVRNAWADAVSLVSVYGPTEACTGVMALKGVTSTTDCSKIGWCFGLNVVYILNERLRPVPLGCVGELFISGPQLALGYLKKPQETALTFVSDPFRPGLPMYATGDLVRMNPQDASITFVDRRDTQIKVRGLRVEAGEIEAVLQATSNAVTNAVVVKVNIGHDALLAVVECQTDIQSHEIVMVSDDNTASLLASLKLAVHQKLPVYMAPAMYMVLNRFPLTSSGKLHRKALVEFFELHKEEIRTHDIDTFTGHMESTGFPHTESQALIRSLWASVLQVNQGSLSVDTNFYVAGGDSILAIRLATLARQAGLSLLTTDIIRNPTIRAMAEIASAPSVVNEFVDDTSSITLERMTPTDLTLLNLSWEELDFLRNDLLPKHCLSPSDVIDMYPSTYLQTSFLLAGLVVDHTYINNHIYYLPSDTNGVKLRRAFKAFLNHPNGAMLRTVFVFEPRWNRYLQALIKPGVKRIEWTTVVVSDEADLPMAIDEYQRGRGSHAFADGSLLTRACVFEINGSARALAWVLHHALYDGWTQRGHVSDIEDAYAGRPLPVRRSFKHMVKYLEGLDRAAGLEFWKHKLQTATPTLFLQPLPGAARATTNASTTRVIRAGHTSVAREFGIMASTLATAAWAFVLAAHTGSSDVVFGQIVAGRSAPISDIVTMVGTCINTVPRRVVLNPTASVIDTLRDIQADQTDINKHEYITLSEIQSQGIQVSALFRSLLNIINVPERQQGQDDLVESLLNSSTSGMSSILNVLALSIDLPLGLDVSFDSRGSVRLNVSYQQEVISAAEIEALLDHYETAMSHIVSEPLALVRDINFVSATEKQCLLFGRNPPHPLHALLSPGQNVSQLIEWQVEMTPQRIALQFEQEVFLTYRRMNSLSNDLASSLVNEGAKRGSLVAIYMDKSIEMFLSILAVHKAGSGYVPLDPEHPPERIQTIIRLAQATIVLTTRELQDQLGSALPNTGVCVVLVDFRELSPASKPDVGPIGRDDISHVLFTSGSTGTPKGVVLTHGSTIESALGSREALGTLNGRVLQFSNYTFDFSVWDWTNTLSAGGTLCIVPKRRLMDDLGSIARSLDITYIGASPTVAALITPKEIPSLLTLGVGGELLTAMVRDTWADAVSVVNAYGPTEANVGVVARRGVTSSTACSNVGWRFGLNSVYILDERRRPTPLGCVGELFIGGPQLARGYLNSPEETAKAFISDPFRPGSLMYATGDLVRMSPEDESITFVDRRDTQIKIRGLRVEAGEIEAVLQATSNAVTNAAVIKVDVGHECLVAFLEYPSDVTTETIAIVRCERLGPLLTSLRHAVRQKLPIYMAPSLYVALNRFPVSSSGKLDRKTLKAFFYSHATAIQEVALCADNITLDEQDAGAPPLTELQATIRSLWASTLRIPEASLHIDDDFYTAGGDSISAIRLASAAREAGIHLPATDIIRNPTIRAMTHIAESAVINHDYDDDDIPSVALDQMCPRDLTLLDFDQAQLDSLRDSLLPQHGISPRQAFVSPDVRLFDVLDVYPSIGLQIPLLMAGASVQDAYIVSQAWDLPSGTESIRLRQAFENFVDHANGMMLRTLFVFEPTSNRWLQVLIRPGAKQMEWMTVVVADEVELDSRVDEYRQGRSIQRFEDGELLTRACLFELGDRPRVLVWSLHHVLADHRTLDSITSDIEDVYAGRSLSPRRPFKPVVSYLEKLDRTSGLDFWRRHLEGAAPTPFLQSPPGVPRAITDATVIRAVHTEHGSFTRRSGIMPSTLATAAWATVLAAHSNCGDVVFGQILAGRNAPIKDIGSMTGITINTVARRVALNPDATVIETLRHIQSDQIEMGKHEYITLADLHSEGIPVSGLFKTLLNFRNLPHGQAVDEASSPDAGTLFSKDREGGRDGLDFPLALSVDVSSADDLFLSMAFVADTISEAEVNAILDHFETALLFLMHHPDATIGDVELTSAAEKCRLLFGRNSPDPLHRHLSSGQNISELIEWQVAKTPQRIALQFEQEIFLTYGEMDSLSNSLARSLINGGIERGTLVGMYMDKSIEMFLSILAVHKAGGGYVPLDPEHPPERIQTIVGLAQATMVLTTRELKKDLDSVLVSTGVQAVLVDFREISPATKPDVGPIGRDDVSHVLFTSGSTGTPKGIQFLPYIGKGVVLTHGSTIESALGSREALGTLDGRVLQFSNYTFDFSVWDWTGTLSAGGTLCVAPKRRLLDDLESVARSLDVTYLGASPTVAALITPDGIPSLLTLGVGGELLTAAVRDTWADNVCLVNAYGPTEANVGILARRGLTTTTGCSNIGWRFGVSSVYILDERRRPVPLGCVGELFISGPQLARGYLNSPEETAKAFINDPFRPGSLMYATGDLVRMSPEDESITFVDRRDTQIKIRGLRVEAGEIEAVLQATSNAVTNAVVVKVNISHDALLAFVECQADIKSHDIVMVWDERTASLLSSLKLAVRQKLPVYMAPAMYVVLNRFPLTSSGKLHRKALVEFFEAHEDEIRTHDIDIFTGHIESTVLPHTESQALIRSLWASVLHVNEGSLSVDVNFYVAGGDSILAIRLATLARQAGFSFLPTDIIRHPTIRAMAEIASAPSVFHEFVDDTPSVTLERMTPTDLTLLTLDSEELDFLRNDLLPKHGLSPSDIIDVYPCTYLQTSFLLAGLMVDHAYINTHIYDLPRNTDGAKLRQAFESFLNHSNGAMLRTAFVFDPRSNRYLQALAKPGVKQMEWTTIVVADEVQLPMAVDEYQRGRGSRAFANGNLLTRACVFEINGSARALVWVLHHALYDGWTQRGHVSDIEDAYAGRPLPVRRSFKHMVKYLEGLDRTAGLEFWKHKLQTATPTPFLQPFPDTPRATTNASATRVIRAGHTSVAREFGVMASTLATAAWAFVLATHTGSSDVVFGQIVAGRSTFFFFLLHAEDVEHLGLTFAAGAPISDIETMIGTCINTVPRRIVLDPKASIIDTLRGIQTDQTDINRHEYITLSEIQSQGIPVSGLFRSLLNIFNGLENQQGDHEGLLNSSASGVGSIDLPFGLDVSFDARDNFTLNVYYQREVISAAEVEALLDHYETAMNHIVSEPLALVQDINLVSAKEQQRLLFGHNPPYPLHELLSPVQNVSQLIERQVEKTPQRIALQFEQEAFLTYSDMASLSNGLASSLVNKGVKRSSLVAVYMDKSIEMFLSILAVHKAGGGYVPLDPEHPPERIQTIVALAQAVMVLTTRGLQDQLSSALVNTGVHVVLVDFKELLPAAEPDVGPISRDDISHVLFTSGSTGTPKGVVLTHGSTIESTLGSQATLGTLNGRVLQFLNYTFDVSIWDWTNTLSAGGTLCVVPKRRLMDDLELVARSLDITYMGASPTVAALITPEEIPSLLVLCVGGELLTAVVRNTWADAVFMVNIYGPTEANVSVVARRGVTSSTACSNVGWRFGLNSVYILDERRRPTPLGCVGELFIGGPQLARGYLNSPEETAKAFISDPFRPGSLMYATGDLVRMSPEDESITFVDRRDTQIKIRGLRVEAGEIEAVLQATSNAVTNAAVIKVDVGHECLVAFLEYPSDVTTETIAIVRCERLGPLLTSLRHAVRQKLPIYMAPSLYVALNRFPVSSSGKLDRKTLKAFFYSHATAIQEVALCADNITLDEQDAGAPPLTELQATIRSLWASTLRIPEASLHIDDDFYTAGGDSISAIRLASAAREAGIHLPATDIIRNPTIRAMTHIAESAVINHDYDDDDIPSVALDQMCPRDLTLLDFDQAQLDSLRDSLLPQHGISPRQAFVSPDVRLFDVLDVYPSIGLQIPLLMAGASVQDAYIVSQAWDLPSGTESIRLRQAFENFVDHANGMMLRTLFVFEPTSNRWLQVLIRPGAKQMEWMTVVVADEVELDSRVDEYRQGRSIQRFEDGELLTRACLFELGDRPRVLVWSLHHVLADHRTLDSITSDIEDVYAGRSLSPRRPFKPVVSYLEKLDRTSGLDFWRRHLEGAAPTPFLQSPPGVPRAITDATVIRAVHTEHGSFTRRSGIMPSTLATAAWATVLAAHSNCGDVVFGQILAGRNAPIKDIGSMTGITINTVARRVALNPDATVIETLRHIQSDQIEMGKHEYITLADLHSEGIPVSGLFKTLLNFRNLPHGQAVDEASSPDAGTLFSKDREGGRDGLDFPLALSVDVSSADDLFLSMAFVADTISEAEVNAILDHFETALLFLMHHPDATIGDVELTSAAEKCRLLFGRNSPDPLHRHLSSGQNISELIEWQVAKTPQRIALQFEQEIFLTYGEMDSLSNSLARSLINGGIERGTLVGMYMDKSIEMFLSILAVHKAGGGYVPLDPEHPPERIQTIVGLAQATMVLTTRELKKDLDSVLVSTGVQAVLVDFREISPATKPDVGPIGRDDVSHVLFTSGSTGTPKGIQFLPYIGKGVVLTHGSTIESALGSREALGTLDGRVLQFSNYTFDFSVWDWTGTLSAGGTLCVAPKRRLLDDLESVARSLDVTYLGASPTVAALITPDGIPSLLTLGVGGELLTAAVRDTWADNVCLVNAYGPTEANVGILARRGLTTTTGCSNIGWRFGVSSVYILDERRRPVPLGCVGELFISGPQLARGYLNSPEETAKAFINDPFRPGSLMYATGDLVRMSPEDESITFVDRRDTQIKIRGLRVEAGEIEAVLQATSNAVTNAVVVKVNIGHDALLAFVECQADIQSHDIVMVWDERTASLLSSLKLVVRQKLPVYMAPAMYVVLNRFPLTSSGKLHRKGLIEFFEAHNQDIRNLNRKLQILASAGSTNAGRTRPQSRIMKLWQAVLGIQEDIDIDATFAFLGGDSVDLMRLSALAFKQGIALSVTEQLHRKTIRAQAHLLLKV
ncbi:acetyl-CoA synthetase-like protein [Ramaria rubella]|nr:acetyl-CoA synthetase-like protein [Ramaria rubella]